MKTEVWRKKASGELFVVHLNEQDEDVEAAAGPLQGSQVDDAILNGFRTDMNLVDRLDGDSEDYEVLASYDGEGRCSVCGGPAHFQPCADLSGKILPQYPGRSRQ